METEMLLWALIALLASNIGLIAALLFFGFYTGIFPFPIPRRQKKAR